MKVKPRTLVLVMGFLAIGLALIAVIESSKPLQSEPKITDAQLESEVQRVEKAISERQERIEISKTVWRELLTDEEYSFVVEQKTEPAFQNEYWDNKREGLYVTVGCGQPVFSSRTKYVSGTGWPSFWEPINDIAVIEEADYRYGLKRTLVRGSQCNEYLGHVFTDGPRDKTGLRYCLNSGALDFIPKEELVDRGYEEYVALFAI